MSKIKVVAHKMDQQKEKKPKDQKTGYDAIEEILARKPRRRDRGGNNGAH